MQRDMKLGLALGVLLIGIVGAFFFRNENILVENFPRLKNPNKLDKRIAEKQFFPYLTGVETDTDPRLHSHANKPSSSTSAPLWEIPYFLKPGGQNNVDPVAQAPVAPNPIPVHAYAPPTQQSTSIPAHNKAWIPDSVNRQPRAQKVQPQPAKKVTRHRVLAGETLSALAARYLGSSSRFLELFEANRDLLKSPNDLIVGTEIRIPVTATALTAAKKQKITQRTKAKPVSAQRPAKIGDHIEAVPTKDLKTKRILWQQPPTILNNAD